MLWTWLILTVAYVVAIFIDSAWVWLGLTVGYVVVIIVTLVWLVRLFRATGRDCRRRRP
jgi:hypothetical protein